MRKLHEENETADLYTGKFARYRAKYHPLQVLSRIGTTRQLVRARNHAASRT